MAIGKLFYEAIGETQMAAKALRPQLYYVWAVIKSAKDSKLSRVDLEKLCHENGVTQNADFKNFIDHTTSILKKKKWIKKSRVVI